MNLLHQYAGHLLIGGGALASTVTYLFRDILRDIWQDYRRRRNAEPRQVQGSSADRIGAEAMHQLIDLLRKDLDDRKEEEGKRWQIVNTLAEGLKNQAQSFVDLNGKVEHGNTLLGVLASRRS